MKYVATTDRRFDVIIVDSTDPQGPGAVLFTKEFYAACKRCMAPGGVMVTQNGVPFLQPDELISSVGMFKSLFADGACYVAAIPTYVGGHMAMGWAAKDRKLRQHPVRTIAARYKKGRKLQDQILDARGACRGLRAAALHRRACESARGGSARRYSTFARKASRHSVRDASCLIFGQLREPLAIGLHDAVVGEPALVDPGIGAEQEAVGMAARTARARPPIACRRLP